MGSDRTKRQSERWKRRRWHQYGAGRSENLSSEIAPLNDDIVTQFDNRTKRIDLHKKTTLPLQLAASPLCRLAPFLTALDFEIAEDDATMVTRVLTDLQFLFGYVITSVVSFTDSKVRCARHVYRCCLVHTLTP